MSRFNKAVIFALLSVFAVQYIAPAVVQTVDVLSNDSDIRRIIRQRTAGA